MSKSLRLCYDLLDKLTSFLGHETRLLQGGQIKQALALVRDKENLMQEWIRLSSGMTPDLSEQDKKNLFNRLSTLRAQLETNHRVLEGVYKAHEKLMGVCIEAVKKAMPPVTAYNKYGQTDPLKPTPDSMGFSKKL